jgi:uncharacterized protein (TIGR02594 family)
MDRAWSHIGVKETPGAAATPDIVAMYAKAGNAGVVSDEVPWCAAFVGACLTDAGLPNTGSLMARSYLKYGSPISEPKVGALAVFKRGTNPASGHVAFVTGWGAGYVRVIGGNQSNAVTEANYRESDLLEYRWPPASAEIAASVLAAPLRKSGTVWGTITGAMAGAAAFAEQSLASLIEWAAKLSELAPVSAALASMGGNVKSMTLGLGIGAAVFVISRRWRAYTEGKPG